MVVLCWFNPQKGTLDFDPQPQLGIPGKSLSLYCLYTFSVNCWSGTCPHFLLIQSLGHANSCTCIFDYWMNSSPSGLHSQTFSSIGTIADAWTVPVQAANFPIRTWSPTSNSWSSHNHSYPLLYYPRLFSSNRWSMPCLVQHNQNSIPQAPRQLSYSIPIGWSRTDTDWPFRKCWHRSIIPSKVDIPFLRFGMQLLM